MILMANLYVLKVRPSRLWPYYSLLIAALAFNSVVPMATFLSLPGCDTNCRLVRSGVSSGVFRRCDLRDRISRQHATRRRFWLECGRNHPGEGLSEYLSLVLGFNHLLWVAIVYYAVSAWMGRASVTRT